MARRTLLYAVRILLVAVVVSCGGSSPVATVSTPSPRPSPTMTTADKTELAQLEARPMKLPALLKDGTCQPDSQDTSLGLWGADPVYIAGGPQTSTPFGDYFDVSAQTKPGLTGPVLLRGRDLKVANHPVVFVGPRGAGPVYGSDPVNGTQYTELVLDTRHAPAPAYLINGTKYVEWDWRQGVAKGWTGCVGFQIDGPTFSEDINVNVPV